MFIDRRQLAAATPEARSHGRGRLGLDESTPLLGIVGTVGRRKGMLHAVQAMPRILSAHPKTRLAVVGSLSHSEYVDQVRALARQLRVDSHVLWLGQRDDVHELMPAMDVYLQPSLDEPLGLSILEAMASGLPVVATRVGGIPEVIVPGETGLLVPPANGDALADATIALLDDPTRRQQYGAAGRARVLAQFAPDALVPRIEAVFQRVVHPRRAA